MMREAGRYHLFLAGVIAVCIVAFCAAAAEVLYRLKAQGLCERLLSANVADIPATVTDMKPYRRWVEPILARALVVATNEQDQAKQLRASLALLPSDSTQTEYLYRRLLEADPEELRVIRNALKEYEQTIVVLPTKKDQPIDPIRKQVEKVLVFPNEDPDRRLRAACALADQSPTDMGWEAVAPAIVDQLLLSVQRNPSHYSLLIDMLRPVRASLSVPLAAIYRSSDRPDAERTLAATILAEYDYDQPTFLADLLMDGSAKQFVILFARLRNLSGEAGVLFDRELKKSIPLAPGAKSVPEDAKERLAKRQANAAVALLRMSQAAEVWPLLKHRTDPRLRSYLIHDFSRLEADPHILVQQLEVEPDVSVRQALILGLGEYRREQLTTVAIDSLQTQLDHVYRNDPDSGIHGAVAWLLGKWGRSKAIRQADGELMRRGEQQQNIQAALARGMESASGASAEYRPRWYVNSQGQTFVIIPGPAEFQMGSPPIGAALDADERQHMRRIPRTYAVASSLVTRNDFNRFLRANPETQTKFDPDNKMAKIFERYSPDTECPIIGVPWYMAAAYCNWLSEMDGLPKAAWCYETNKDRRYAPGMRTASGYLTRSGYRLPTEAEWEYACRAGSTTSRHYGESSELLDHYGWSVVNSQDRSWPVRSLKPNEWGLFDIHGNVWNWCQNPDNQYPSNLQEKPFDDADDGNKEIGTEARVMRGGSFIDPVANLRSAYRGMYLAGERAYWIGFRPVRSIRFSGR
jgi:formylglycine-generating enzyme required for sulfatase activity